MRVSRRLVIAHDAVVAAQRGAVVIQWTGIASASPMNEPHARPARLWSGILFIEVRLHGDVFCPLASF